MIPGRNTSKLSAKHGLGLAQLLTSCANDTCTGDLHGIFDDKLHGSPLCWPFYPEPTHRLCSTTAALLGLFVSTLAAKPGSKNNDDLCKSCDFVDMINQ